MSLMLRAWKAEAAQALRRRDQRVAAIAVLVAAILYAMLLATLLQSEAAPDAVTLFTGTEDTGFAVAFQTAKALLRLLALLLLLWSAAAVAGELETGTHRSALLRLPRGRWMLGKAAHLALVAAALSLCVVLLALAAGGLRLGLEPVRAGGIVLWSTGGLLATAAGAWAMSLPPLLALVALGICVSSALRSVQAATTATLFAAALLWVAGILPGGEGFSFLAALDWPWQVAINHGEGMKTLSFADRWLPHLAVNLGWTAGLLALAGWTLRRRDLL